MPMDVPANTYLVKLRWRCVGDAEEMISTIGASGWDSAPIETNGDGDSGAQQVADKIHAAWAAATPAASISQDWTFTGVDAIAGPLTESPDQGTNPNFIVGTFPAGTPPVNTAVLVSKRTSLGGRRNRGRMFLPPANLPEAEVSSAGMISPMMIDSYGAKLDAFQTYVETEGPEDLRLQLLLFHFSDGTPIAPTRITDLIVSAKVATQRRRLR